MTIPKDSWSSRLTAAKRHVNAAIASLRNGARLQQGLETLTPVLLEPTDSTRYEQEMVAALADPNIRNIAITGGYGAGKSSLIRTFKENNPCFKYASVSLATFRKEGLIKESADDLDSDQRKGNDSNQGALNPEQIAVLVERIEEAIVQQLLYAVPATKLPRTRLKRITQPSSFRSWIVTVVLSLTAIVGTHLFLLTRTAPLSQGALWLSERLSWIPIPLALAVVCVVGALALHQVVRSLSLLNIDGWSIKGGTIESMQHSSVLHKNVDELLYCFQNSEIDVVVIEDLDRFGIQDVFFRLREINAIINESPQIKRNVRFVYALNDELFAGSEKTKFFDLILPVVPVINKENSHAKMIELLAKRGLKGTTFAAAIDDELIETVSYRIDDMRLVKNIVNELDIFAKILTKDLPLPVSKIFAIIVVKNLHSNQYWQLAKRTGFLYNLISGYASWRSTRAEEIRSEILENEQTLARKHKDAARNIKELRVLAWYFAETHVGASGANYIILDGTHYTKDQYLEDDVFESLTKGSNLRFLINGSRAGSSFSFSQILSEMNYDIRCQAIDARDTELHSEILSKQAQLRDLHKLPLSQALLDGYQDSFTVELAKHETIRYLLVAGHLDEDYADYLGHFYGHAIGREDMNLIFTLRQGEECDVAASIKEPEKFLRKLRPRNIDRGRGIIAELLLYLARSYRMVPLPPHADFLERILDDVPAHLPRFIEALDILIQRQEEQAIIRAMYDLRPALISSVLKGSAESVDTPRPSHVVAVLSALRAEQLRSIEEVDLSFKKNIEALADASGLVSGVSRESDAWKWINSSKVRFNNLAGSTSPEVLSTLVELDALSPSLAMLRLVALNGELLEPPTPPVTLVRLFAADCIPFVEGFVATHLSEIVEQLVSQEVPLDESAEVVVATLKDIEGHEDLALQFFETTKSVFPTLEVLGTQFWDSAMQGDRVLNRASALRSYVAHRSSSGSKEEQRADQEAARTILINYANKHASSLAGDLWSDEEVDELLQEWIANEAGLDDQTVLNLLSDKVITKAAILSDLVSDERMQLLARNGHFAPSSDIWELIRVRDLEVKVAYLETSWGKIRLTNNEPVIELDLATRLYQDGIFPTEDALRIFAAIDEAQLSGEVETIGSLAQRAVIDGPPFPPSLMRVAAQMLQSGVVHQRWKSCVLVKAMPVMEWPAIAEVLHALGGDLVKLSGGRSAEVSPDDDVKHVIDALKKCGYASTLTLGKRGKTKVNMKRNLA
ncbi:hypothetical protein [uncultured Stenotrophomonas sp.]|uniref:YobI family P-loop NTPase n=1 Tax=uncultured Stenotrophomonas sp. TaxID=165438 RepID=UPI0025F75E8A|nr:hypothetical protein [uncultured Stenotrophomonas sp.]